MRELILTSIFQSSGIEGKCGGFREGFEGEAEYKSLEGGVILG